MKIAVFDSTRKTFHRVINASTIIAGSFLFLGLVLLFFKSSTLEIIATILFLISILPILTGISCSIALAIKGKLYIEFDEQKETWLILNIKEYDFKIGDKGHMGYSGNYLVQENMETRYEITSDEVEELLANELTANWTKVFEPADTKMLDSSPKRLYKDIMWTLWATS